MSNILNLT